MAQHDYVIANGTGAAVRSDLNNGLAAIVSNNSGATEPATMYAYQWWSDTTTGLLKLRNAANSAWVTVGTLASANLGLAALASPTFTGTVTAPTFTASTAVNIPLGSAGSPTLFFTGDTNTGLFSPGADAIALATAGTNRLHITSAGNVGIGTTGPNWNLSITGGNDSYIQFLNNDTGTGNSDGSLIGIDGGENLTIRNRENTATAFFTNDLERGRFDNSGRLLVGTSTAIGSFQFAGSSRASGCQIVGDTIDNGSFAVVRTTTGPVIYMGAGTSGTNVISGNALGYHSFHGYHTSAYYEGARITAVVDGTPGAGDMPGALLFSTTADGASSPTERMRITNTGIVSNKTTNVGSTTGAGWSLDIGGAGIFTVSGSECLYVNREVNDGSLVSIRQAGTEEGSISVSGTTVSYNGAHLSRWSQLPGGAEREEILRGTVLSNIDEMCAWDEEDNEQLNRMKVSDVEGDPNVSGVFQAWDDDDDTYTDDFYCAMTGDFIIRIAEGTPVHRGQLLMSAGDGTAKPQDDDIIRSKTIAKVTSNHVTCTYDDGSYCVPCVLMAC